MSFECLVITAGRNEGKTTHALSLFENVPSISGYVSVSAEGKESYELLDLKTGEKSLLMKKGLKSNTSIGPFGVVVETFERANAALIESASNLILIDEVGRLELSGKGFHDSLSVLTKRKDLTLILAIRDEFVTQVLSFYGIKNYALLTGSTLDSVSMPFSVPL
jgi:Predicted nucleotide kinase